MRGILQKWGLPALTLLTFFLLLGSRSLNEPDEGRYAEIAREMVGADDWLVPHLWYLPHLDKPPMTYWLVASSMKMFGQNEWAVRLPVALAGISGVWAVFLMGCSMGGRRAGIWSALILQSSLLYFCMSRMLTPDIFLAQFVAWAMYFFWRSWIAMTGENSHAGTCANWKKFFAWHLAGWAAIALGFLTKGPISLAIPLVAFCSLLIFRRNQTAGMKPVFAGLSIGIVLFFILAAPWFLAVFESVPQSAHFMIFGQVAGHLLGTTIKNRPGGPFYFLGVLAAGLLPWTILLGWLWRRPHWSALSTRQRDGWLFLSVWVIFTFALFSFSRSKLPAYILPIFPALAVMLALRFFSEDRAVEFVPKWAWCFCLACSLVPPLIFPLLVKFAFHVASPEWLKWQIAIVVIIALLIFWLARNWRWQTRTAFTIGLMWLGLMTVMAEIPFFETDLRDNQTLKPIGIALQENYRPGDALVCWGHFPQGLPFYTGSVISATNPPYLGGMDMDQVPFAFPGNRDRLGKFLLPDEKALEQILASDRRVWLVAYGGTVDNIQQDHGAPPLRLVVRVGQWKLFTNH